MRLLVTERNEYNNGDQRYKLDDIANGTGIGINSLRYHIKKLKKLFLTVPRDRYNRYLFNHDQRNLLLKVHELKSNGQSYIEIFNTLNHNTTPIGELIGGEEPSLEQCSNNSNNFMLRLERLEQHNKTTNKINKVLCENNKQLKEIIAEQNIKIDSLEERVALLIDLHTDNLLNKGLQPKDFE